MENKEIVEEFYKKCGELIAVPHTYQYQYAYKTRWNNRKPGNGRFPGWGLIRRYSSNEIHISCSNFNGKFESAEKVFEFLKNKEMNNGN